MKYLFTRSDPIASGGYELTCQFKSSRDLDRPDVQGIFVPMALDTSSTKLKLAKHSGIMFLGYQIRPATTGSVHLSGRLPENAPIINARFLQDDGDRAATAPILGVGRTVFAQGPVADYVRDEEFPGPAVCTPDDVLRYAWTPARASTTPSGPTPWDQPTTTTSTANYASAASAGYGSSMPPSYRSNSPATPPPPAMAAAWIAADLILDPHS